MKQFEKVKFSPKQYTPSPSLKKGCVTTFRNSNTQTYKLLKAGIFEELTRDFVSCSGHYAGILAYFKFWNSRRNSGVSSGILA